MPYVDGLYGPDGRRASTTDTERTPTDVLIFCLSASDALQVDLLEIIYMADDDRRRKLLKGDG